MEFYDRRTAPKRADTWYVYALVDSRDTENFRYIGITNYPRARLSLHLSQAPKEGWKKSRWIQSVFADGAGVLMCVLASGMAQQAAMDMEIELIAEYRANGAALMNLTDGGEGVKGQIKSQETRAKLSAALKGKPKSPEAVARSAAARRGRRTTDEQRAKMSAAHLKRYEDPAVAERQRENNILRYEDPLERERTAKATKARFERAGERERHSATMLSIFRNDPTIVERSSTSRRVAGPQSNNKSGYKGVFFDNTRQKYCARIRVNGANKHIGYFSTAEDAAHAYDAAILTHVGPMAYVNFPSLRPEAA